MSTEKRDTYIFYRSFDEAITELNDADQLTIYKAVTRYALDGEDPELTGFPKAIFKLIKPILEANRKRWENGNKGGRPKTKPKPNGNQNETESKPNNNQTVTKPKANKDKDKDLDKDNNINKESTNVDKKETGVSSSLPDYVRFQSWITENCPYLSNPSNIKQITEAEFNKLKQTYSGKQIADVILDIENRKDLRKKYSVLYKTALNWLKKANDKPPIR